jgi:hypothetical protein
MKGISYSKVVHACACLVMLGAYISCQEVSPTADPGQAGRSNGLKPLGLVSAPLSGAIFSTNVGCTGVNINIFQNKSDVYLDGGPAHGGAAGLPDGYYCAQVTEPNGTVLGKSAPDAVHVTNGKFDQCYQLSVILKTASSGFTSPGYDNTTNPGGEYKVWLSIDCSFVPGSCKTDNFKVKGDQTNPPSTATLTVKKFYDANANGIYDSGDQMMTDLTAWKVCIQDDIDYIRWTTVVMVVDPGAYNVTEFPAIEKNWMCTAAPSNPVTVAAGDNTTVAFGNLCLGAGGGLTLGFWSNKNGQALFGSDDLALMVSLNLRNANGTGFDPVNYSTFRTWLLSATATNMAYMLSAQLAAMELNVNNGKVNGSALIFAPGTTSANALGFATVNAIMAEANTELGTHGTALSGDAWRTYQEALKNALDNANNNKTFVQPTPGPFTFAP